MVPLGALEVKEKIAMIAPAHLLAAPLKSEKDNVQTTT
jgi:hypothetical protein